MKKRILSLLLCISLLIGALPAVALAAEATAPAYGDVAADHWAGDAIGTWSAYGIFQGDNGQFFPGRDLTRGEIATIIARLLGLPKVPSFGFTDVPDGQWYTDGVNSCAAAGIMLGSGGKADPLAPVTREMTMVLLGRALGIKPVADPDLSAFPDGHKAADWSAGFVAAMTDAEIINGIGGKLALDVSIDRASTATILHRAITAYANKDGQTVKATGGIVLVTANNVTVTGTAGSVLVAQGAGNVTLKDAKAENVTMAAGGVKLTLSGKTEVTDLTVASSAAGSTVNVGSGTKVDTLTSEADNVTTSGSGKVTNAIISGDNNKVNTTGTKVTATEEATGTKANGKNVAAGSTTTVTSSSSGSSGGSDYTPPAPVHTHSWGEWTETTPATCTTAGVETRTCTADGCTSPAATETQTIDALGHTLPDSHTVVAPTCTTPGSKTYTCTVCSTAVVETIPATGHTYTATVTAPTCTAQGYTTHTCTCGDFYVDTYVDADGHSWGSTYQEVTVSCGVFHRYTCATCQVTEDRATGDSAHTFGDTATSNSNGTHTIACSGTSCDATTTVACELPETWTVDTPATCTTKGTQSKTCRVCSYKAEEDIAALDHSMKAGTPVSPTCTTDGYTTYTCERTDCRHSYQEAGDPALGHIWTAWTKVGVASAEQREAGTHKRICTRENCGEAPDAVPCTYNAEPVISVVEKKTVGTFTCTENCGNSYQVTYVAAVSDGTDTTYHETFADAKAASQGKTVTVLEADRNLTEVDFETLLSSPAAVVDFNGANAQTDCRDFYIHASKIKNLDTNGLRNGYVCTEAVTFEKCTFAETAADFAFHIDGVSGGITSAAITFNDCTLYGFSTIGHAISSLTFNNCTFENSTIENPTDVINSYQDMIFTDCTFADSFTVDDESKGETNTWTFTNCGTIDKVMQVANVQRGNVSVIVDGNKFTYKDGKIKEADIYTAEGLEGLNKVWTAEESMIYKMDSDTLVLNIMADIDMTGKTWNAPNGQNVVINGNNKTISNLTVAKAQTNKTNDTNKAGFLGYGGAAKINDLTLDTVTASGAQVGAFVGHADYGTELKNCTLKGKITITCLNNTVEKYWGGGAIVGVVGADGISGTVDVTDANFVQPITTPSGSDCAKWWSTAAQPYVGFIGGGKLTITKGDKVLDTDIGLWYDPATTTYEVSTAKEMFNFANAVNDLKMNFSGKTVKLTADIDFDVDKSDTVETDEYWTPIGQTGATQFVGSFDGQKHTISNMTVDISDITSEHDGAGLFGWIEEHTNSVEIKNVKIDKANIKGHQYAGGVVGYVGGAGAHEISSCSVTNSKLSAEKSVGGIVGHIGQLLTVSNVASTGNTITGSLTGRERGVGAIFGRSNSGSTTTMTNVTISGNKITQEGATTENTSDYYGKCHGTATLNGNTI